MKQQQWLKPFTAPNIGYHMPNVIIILLLVKVNDTLHSSKLGLSYFIRLAKHMSLDSHTKIGIDRDKKCCLFV